MTKATSFPSLSDFPEVAEAQRELSALVSRRESLTKQLRELQAVKYSDIEADAQRLLNPDSTPGPKLEELERERHVVDKAIELQKKNVDDVLHAASRKAFEQVQPEQAHRVERVLDAVQMLHDAIAAETELRDRFRDVGFLCDVIDRSLKLYANLGDWAPVRNAKLIAHYLERMRAA